MMEMESEMAEIPGNLDAVCRLCLSQRTDSLKAIFDRALGPNRLPLKIHQLIQIPVTKNDKLPIMVCNDCIIRLDTWYSYKKQCHRNQAKLAEWLSKSTGQNVLDVSIQIKSEPLDMDGPRYGHAPIKTEYPNPSYGDMMDVEFNELPRIVTPQNQSSDHVYLEDLDRETEESEATSVKCPECSRLFGSVQNRRRHQNMVHRQDRRAQMVEIKKTQPETPAEPQSEKKAEQTEAKDNLEQTEDVKNMEQTQPTEDLVQTEAKENSEQTEAKENSEQTQRKEDSEQTAGTTEEESGASVENMGSTAENADNCEMDSSPTATSAELNTHEEAALEDSNSTQIAKETDPMEETDPLGETDPLEETDPLKETDPLEETTTKDMVPETLENPPENQNEENVENKEQRNEVTVEPEENDQQKIEFAAGLKLVQKDSTPIEFESLSKIELSYIEKCKAMVSMFHSLQCACHNMQHKSLRHLLSHLREVRFWFPLFTCYSCMISFTDRSTFTRHHCRCPKGPLETLIKLSNLRKRSEIKTRLYQNYKCNRCKFLYSFHEDFCKHINEDHDPGLPPIYCSCRTVFNSVDEYKSHCYTSCVVSYYCDICFITTVSIEEFVKHCQEVHDSSEGFLLLQEDCYTPKNSIALRQKEVNEEAVIEGKRERRRSAKEPILVQVYDREIPQQDPKDIPTKVLRQMIQLDFQPTTAQEWNRTPTKCPVCKKEYSSVNNMIRHYRTHIEKKEIEVPPQLEEYGDTIEDLYSCPECGGMYPSSKWKKHIEEKHSPVTCTECDKVFQFQSELDQHRSVHLNLKVYRDSKTHSYKTSIISPGAETNGEVMVMCEVCDSMFNSKEDLKLHKLTCQDGTSLSRASSSMDNSEMSVDEPNSVLQTGSNEKLPCDGCGKLYSSAKSLKEHVMNKHGVEFLKKGEYPKKCDYCDKVCSSGAGLALHTQVHERINPDKKGEFPKKCEYCDKICNTGAGLFLHTQMHERMTLGDIKKEKMPIIKTEFVKEKKKFEPEDEDEEESYHTCKRCFKVFGTKGKLKDHMKSHGINPSPKTSVKKSRKILCNLCHVALDSNEALERHKAEEHEDELDGMPTLQNELELDEEKMPLVYTCDVCVETFDTKFELQQHKETHKKTIAMPIIKNKSALIYCKYCKIAFDSVNELTKHMHVEHGESAKPKFTKDKSGSDKPFKCPICAKGFATHGAMTAHCGWHKRTNNTFDNSDNTPQGSRTSKIVKKAKVLKKIAQAVANKQEPIEPSDFQCTTCLMELPNDTALQIHILEKHRGLDSLMLIPRCDTCNQDFVSQEEYETHKRFHDFLVRQKKHEKQLHTQQQQQIQTPIIQSVQSVAESPHSSPKRHPCNWCNSVFSRSDTLNTHIKQNHKEHVRTEFDCTQCDRVFDKQSSLTIHLKVHEKQKNAAVGGAMVVVGGAGKLYSCSICSQFFSYPKDLRMHTINAHPF